MDEDYADWVRHPYTPRMQKTYEHKRDESLKKLLEYCRTSTDAGASKLVKEYDMNATFVRVLSGKEGK
jgi:hypothetical protein